MQQLPLVSVCIAAYNAEDYIRECIDSVLNQSYPNFEVIVVNDGSKDETHSILLDYVDKGVIVINQENRGQCASSNVAFKKATGDYIKFFDADDVLHPAYITEMLKLTKPNKLVFSHCINFVEDYTDPKNCNVYTTEDQIEWSPIDFLVSPVSIMRQGGRWIIPRSIIEKGGLWDETLSLINDYEYFTRLCLASEGIRYQKNAILYYRQLENSLSTQKTEKAFLSAYRSITLAGNQLRSVEDSQRVKKHFANVLQHLVYTMYPNFKSQISKIDADIKELGGSDFELEGGPKILLLKKLFGWKFALWIKYLQNRFIN